MSVKYKIMPPVTYRLHTLCPERHIPLIVAALVLRLLLLDLSCSPAGVFLLSWLYRTIDLRSLLWQHSSTFLPIRLEFG